MLFTTIRHDYIKIDGENNQKRRYRVSSLVLDSFQIPLALLGINKLVDNSPVPEHSSVDSTIIQNDKIPMWYLLSRNLGLIVCLLLASVLLFQYTQHKQTQLAVLSSPKVDDLYFVDLHALDTEYDSKYRYTLLRLDSIDERGGMTFQVGNIHYTYEVSAFAFLTKGAYTRESLLSEVDSISLNMAEAERLFEAGAIYDVKRPEGELVDGWISTKYLFNRHCEFCNYGR